MRDNTIRLHWQILITVLEAIDAWQEWANDLPDGRTKALNINLIRLVKGLVKFWRVWLRETEFEQRKKIRNANK